MLMEPWLLRTALMLLSLYSALAALLLLEIKLQRQNPAGTLRRFARRYWAPLL